LRVNQFIFGVQNHAQVLPRQRRRVLSHGLHAGHRDASHAGDRLRQRPRDGDSHSHAGKTARPSRDVHLIHVGCPQAVPAQQFAQADHQVRGMPGPGVEVDLVGQPLADAQRHPAMTAGGFNRDGDKLRHIPKV
jgi:hypothetical protein